VRPSEKEFDYSEGLSSQNGLLTQFQQGFNGVFLPIGLILALFIWESFRFINLGVFISPTLVLVCVLAFIPTIPLRRTSLAQALQIYAWFLFVSALVAYLDYENMVARGLWFSDRSQDDPGKYIELAQTASIFAQINDPGFVALLRYFSKLLMQFGEFNFIGELNCVMVISSLFAVCCVEIAHYVNRNSVLLPCAFLFNPLVVSLNASLMRDIMVGAIGWMVVIFGVRLLISRAQILAWSVFCFVGCCLIVYLFRSVSAVFFMLTTLLMVVGEGSKVNKSTFVLISLGLFLLFFATGRDMLTRSMDHVDQIGFVMDEAQKVGSIASRYSQSVYGRTIIAIGATIVYGMPFWRITSPFLIGEALLNFGSLFSQLVTAFPLLVGLISIVRRPTRFGWGLLLIYFGWCAVAAVMGQYHIRYITSHLLPVISAIGVMGGDVLNTPSYSRKYLHYGLLLLGFLVVQVLIEIQKLGR